MSTTSNNHTHDPGQEPDVIEIDTEKQPIYASNKGGKKPDPVRQYYETVEPTDEEERAAAERQRRLPVQCKGCKRRFSVAQSRAEILRQHSLICRNMQPADRQEHTNRMAARSSTSNAAGSTPSAPAAAGTKRKLQMSLGRYPRTGGQEQPLPPGLADQADTNLTLWLAEENIPFAALDSKRFRAFCMSLEPQYKVPSAYTARLKLLPQEYAAAVTRLTTVLEESDNLTLTVDNWTDTLHRSVLAAVIILPDRRYFLLEALDLSAQSHTAELLAGDALHVQAACAPVQACLHSLHACHFASDECCVGVKAVFTRRPQVQLLLHDCADY